MHEVQDVSQRAHGLRHGRDRADLRGVSPLMRSSPGSISSLSANTVSYDNGAGTDIEGDYVHLQICNACNEVCLPARLLYEYNNFDMLYSPAYYRRQVPMSQLPLQTLIIQLGM